MVLKVHNVNGSTKMVAIHEAMNARDVCILLAERNHQEIGPNWTLVEKLTDLYLGMCMNVIVWCTKLSGLVCVQPVMRILSSHVWVYFKRHVCKSCKACSLLFTSL